MPLLTATGDERVAAQAFRSGVSDYLLKTDVMPDPSRLRQAIADAVRPYKMDQRNRTAARELKLANLNLEDCNQRLREMTDTAHRFVDNVAHEFRTPLTVIHEFASIMRDGLGGAITPDQMQYLNCIQNGVRDLSTLVDDFLDTSKLKARTLRVDRREAKVDELFERVRSTVESRANAKSITVSFEAEPCLPLLLFDIEKAGRVLLNLVVNAVKFSPQGSRIEIGASATASGDVSVWVRDHGTGISEEDLPKLCERFQQCAGASRDSGKGFGLGLSIARDLAWVNLGTIPIQGVLGEGSTLSFTLPVSDAEHVLYSYAMRVTEAEVLSQVSAMRINSVHPGATAEMLRSALSSSCKSLDLMLSSHDGGSLIAIGPSEEPDRWVARLSEAWSVHGPESMRKAPLKIDWVGSWPVQQLAQNAVPLILSHLIQERRSA